MKKSLFLLASLMISGSTISLNLIANHTHDTKTVTELEVRNDHSGRTNSSGCHKETKTGGYHCH